MNKFLKIILLIFVAFISISLFVSVFLVRNRMDERVFGDKFITLVEKNRFQVTPKHDYVNIFVIPLKNPALLDKSDYIFRITENGNMVREIPFSGYNVGDPSDVRFQFEAIPGSRGKEFGVEFNLPNSDSRLMVNVTEEGGLSYTSYYRPQGFVNRFTGVINNWLEAVKNNPGFFALWAVGLVILAYKGAKNDEK